MYNQIYNKLQGVIVVKIGMHDRAFFVVQSTNVQPGGNTNVINDKRVSGIDKVTLSKEGRAKSNLLNNNNSNSALKGLIEQKGKLIEQKNNVITKMVENDNDVATQKSKIKEIEDQLKKIDEQISKIQMEEQQKNLKADEETKKKAAKTENHEAKEEQGVSISDMDSIIASGNALKELSSASKMRKEASGQLRVLENEIKTDEARSLDGRASAMKYKDRTKLESKIEKMEEEMGKKTAEAKEKAENKK